MAQMIDLFRMMMENGASDLHMSSGAPLYLRVNGEMKAMSQEALTNEQVQSLVFSLLNEKQKRLFIENWELDCSYSVADLGRFRCNVFMQRKGMGAVFREIPEKIKTPEQLGLPQCIMDLINCPKGLIVVTGPTGSGKSTTLAALIHHINATEHCHILTIEDPIEFVHPNMKSLVNQREVSSHTKSFANALKAALREDPDIVLVGEMRDLETIQLAITAAETGHLVFGTLHTNSAAKTVDRIIDVFPHEAQSQIRKMLSESLRGVIAQTLLRTADGKGRCGVYEVLRNTNAVGNLIREGKTFQIPSAMQVGMSQGMITFEHSLNELVKAGKITREAMQAALGNPSGEKEAQGTAAKPAGQGTPAGMPKKTA